MVCLLGVTGDGSLLLTVKQRRVIWPGSGWKLDLDHYQVISGLRPALFDRGATPQAAKRTLLNSPKMNFKWSNFVNFVQARGEFEEFTLAQTKGVRSCKPALRLGINLRIYEPLQDVEQRRAKEQAIQEV